MVSGRKERCYLFGDHEEQVDDPSIKPMDLLSNSKPFAARDTATKDLVANERKPQQVSTQNANRSPQFKSGNFRFEKVLLERDRDRLSEACKGNKRPDEPALERSSNRVVRGSISTIKKTPDDYVDMKDATDRKIKRYTDDPTMLRFKGSVVHCTTNTQNRMPILDQEDYDYAPLIHPNADRINHEVASSMCMPFGDKAPPLPAKARSQAKARSMSDGSLRRYLTDKTRVEGDAFVESRAENHIHDDGGIVITPKITPRPNTLSSSRGTDPNSLGCERRQAELKISDKLKQKPVVNPRPEKIPNIISDMHSMEDIRYGSDVTDDLEPQRVDKKLKSSLGDYENVEKILQSMSTASTQVTSLGQAITGGGDQTKLTQAITMNPTAEIEVKATPNQSNSLVAIEQNKAPQSYPMSSPRPLTKAHNPTAASDKVKHTQSQRHSKSSIQITKSEQSVQRSQSFNTKESKTKPSSSMKDWNTDDVSDFLFRLNLGKYVEVFRENQVDGELLMSLDQEMLEEEFNMKSKFDILKLNKAIKEGWLPK
ncbi:predicted protein [Nematostella vectensis]|uniref:SAM domain-containing protein n=2 Tax=Nematostella vectensis TaxID=45351 RepID=A7SN06_NEMVE|nr:predicted protein [Nematostella vectensis]|eukprot:XP_001627008.1 predicted protein [Nematostella vectensis]